MNTSLLKKYKFFFWNDSLLPSSKAFWVCVFSRIFSCSAARSISSHFSSPIRANWSKRLNTDETPVDEMKEKLQNYKSKISNTNDMFLYRVSTHRSLKDVWEHQEWRQSFVVFFLRGCLVPMIHLAKQNANLILSENIPTTQYNQSREQQRKFL